MSNDDITSDNRPTDGFNDATENQKWAMRYGGEPLDTHWASGDGGAWASGERGTKQEPGFWNTTSGIEGFFNHNYIEIGKINKEGEFEVQKRVHGMSIEFKDGKPVITGDGRLFGFVIDGKYNTFENDDLIQHDDPHHEKEHQLQHADVDRPFGDAYTKVVFEGTEREVLQLYGSIIRATIEINNQDNEFKLFSQNSNTFNAEMKEKIDQMAEDLGISNRLGKHNPWGWDKGSDPDTLKTTEAKKVVEEWGPIEDLRQYIEGLEQTAAKQWDEIQEKGIEVDLKTEIPAP